MSKVTLITKKTEVITLKTGPRGPQGIEGHIIRAIVDKTPVKSRAEKCFGGG